MLESGRVFGETAATTWRLRRMALDELHSALARRAAGYAPVATAPVATAPVPVANGTKEEKKEKKEKVVKEKPTWGEPGKGKEKKEAKAKAKVVEEEIVKTPYGEKKDMSRPMAATYNPKAVESAWDAWWEKKGFFTPDAKAAKGSCESKRFVMVIPPPNVTGKLHLGHTLTGSIEDALSRWNRMCGNQTLWVPGVDHAGIATQSIVERRLLKEEKLTRHDLGRDEFLKRVWQWKEMNAGHIKGQLQRLASSVDWTRERFTMDDRCARAVEEAFIRFHDQGLIYRDNRLVNWCPHLRTALSDLEVDHEDIAGKTYVKIPGFDGKVEVGVLCEFKYPIKGTKDALIVATTRLETMLGDTAVAVHPEDDRYKAYHGKELEHPFFPDRKMVVIADAGPLSDVLLTFWILLGAK